MNIVNKIDYLVGDKKNTKIIVPEPYDDLSCDFIADLSLQLNN